MNNNAIHNFRRAVLLAAKLPAYVSLPLGLALFSSVWLFNGDVNSLRHRIAHLQPDEQFSAVVVFYVVWSLAICLPLLLALGSVVWLKETYRKLRIARLTRSVDHPDALHGLTWEEFEQIVGQAFVRKGYEAEVTQSGADGGVDVICRKDGFTWYVQAKHWRSAQVGVDVVRSFFGACAADGVAGGYIITSGEFTKDARAFADKAKQVTLLNGQAFTNLVKLGRTPQVSTGKLILPPETHADPARVVCPDCSAPMIKRKALQGIYKGTHFFGCSRFPDCTSILNIDG